MRTMILVAMTLAVAFVGLADPAVAPSVGTGGAAGIDCEVGGEITISSTTAPNIETFLPQCQ